MVEIRLDEKDGKYNQYNINVNVTNETYLTDFKKITYTIEYQVKIESWLSSWWTISYTFHVYIINHTNQTVFTYNANQPNHEVKKVEAYYSTKHDKVPLVIGFFRKDPNKFTYYTYLSLTKQYKYTGFPPNNQFFKNDLEQRLKDEDDRVNRIKFTNGGSYKNCKQETHQVGDLNKYVKYCYTVENNKRYDDHVLTKSEIFSHEKGIDVDASYFSSVNEQYYDQVCVYYTSDGNKVLLVEFVNDKTKKHFVRQDCYGYYWAQQQRIDNVETELEKIQTASESRLSYLINHNDPYNGVTVTDLKDTTSFDKFKHTPKSSEITPGDNNSHDKIALLLYNDRKIIIQPNASIPEGKKLTGLENHKPSSVSVYYDILYGSEHGKPPLVIELVSKSNEGTEAGGDGAASSKTYWLRRVDKQGLLWTQFNNQSENLGQDEKIRILADLKHSSNKSIVVQMDKKNPYLMNLILNHMKNGFDSTTHPPTQISVKEQIISSSNYKFYEHDLSVSSRSSESKNIVSIRCYYKTYEFQFQSTSNKNLKLDHHPGKEKTNTLITYFYTKDDLALMLSYDAKFYRPKSLKDYFTWEQVSGISNTNDTENIKRQLNEINKTFNEIKLDTTNGDSYGKIGKREHEDILDLKARITFTNNKPHNNSFIRLKHSTTNTGPIGKITHSGSELNVLEGELNPVNGTPISNQITNDNYNTVYAYYHRSDLVFKTALLLGISKGASNNPDLFFERIDNTDTSKWKRVSGTSSLISDNGMFEKINKLHYDFNSSIMIQIEKQFGTSSNTNYPVKLVKNIRTTESSEPQSDGNITVSEDNIESSLESNYKCLKHFINLGNTKPSDVGGLRFYVHEKELTFSNNTGNLFIYFNYLQVYVYVYFHNKSKVPLLLAYDKKYYGPTSRDQYFDKWEEKTDIGDNITQKLDEINRFLNNIELSETTNSKSGKKYGIIKPGKDPPKGLGDDFYNRICVKPCVTTNYRKLTHSTINKFGIGSILFHGKPISTIQVQSNENEVFVYYDVNDIFFFRPLIISLSSQPQEEAKSSITRKWYKRKNLQGTDWSPDVNSTYTSDYEAFKDKLSELSSNLFTVLDIEIHQQKNYDKNIISKTYQTINSELKVNNLNTCGGFEIKEHKCYEHQISDYYSNIKFSINLQHLKQESQQNPTLVIQPSISGIKLGLYNQNKVAPLLTYGNTEFSAKKSLFVYFYNPYDGEEDTVPLLYNYNTQFYGPSSKANFFSTWKNLNIQTTIRGASDPDPSLKIKENLIRIYSCLNEIDLSQTKNYGIPCCSKHKYYHNREGFSTKRVQVTCFKNSTHIMYLHNTVNRAAIGLIKGSDDSYNFNQHSELITKQTIDEVAVIFKGLIINNEPILVFLNKANKYDREQSSTYGYYYQDDARGDMHTKYKFYPITGGCKIISKLMGQSEEDCVKQQTKVLGSKWSPIIATPMNLVRGTEQSDVDTTGCKGPFESEEQIEKCPEGNLEDKSDVSTYAGSDSSRDDQHQDGRQDRSLLNGRSSSGSVNTQEQVPAAPREALSTEPAATESLGHEAQDDRPKVGLGAPDGGGDGLGDSGAMVEGTKAGHGTQSPRGPRGDKGETGEQGRTEASPPASSSLTPDLVHTTTTHRNEVQTQEQLHTGNGGNVRAQNGGVASPQGPRGETGPIQSPGSSGDENSTKTKDIGEQITEFFETVKKYADEHPAEFYGGTGGAVGGVGVIGGVGAVVYKN